MKELFASQLKDKLPAGRRKFARILIDEASSETTPSADQFVLLTGAIECAEDANALDLCFEAANALGATFDIDVSATKLSAALIVLPKPSTRLVADEALDSSLGLFDQLIATDDLISAGKLLAAMRGPAGTDPELQKTVQDKAQELGLLLSNHDRLIAALNQLKHDPNDAAANSVMGRHLCFERGRWEKGLPMLARGSDSGCKPVASEEIASSDATADARVNIADEWWAIAATLAPYEKAKVQQHAANLYREAMPRLEGLHRMRVEKRLAEASTTSAEIEPGAVRKTFRFDDLTLLDNFDIEGQAAVTPKHELELSHGTPSAALSKQKFRYPIRAVFEVYCKADGVLDIFPSILADREYDGFGIAYGADHNRVSQARLFGTSLRLSTAPIRADQVYRIVLSVDKTRTATIELDGKEIYRAAIPGNARPQGVIVLSGGRGHVLYRRCIVTAFPPIKE